MQKFAEGKVSGARMFAIIERAPAMRDVGAPAPAPPTAAATLAAAASGPEGAGDGKAPPVEVVAPHQGTGQLAEVAGRLELADVHFAYPARPDVMVFKCVLRLMRLHSVVLSPV
jgi:hypothetical protein